MELTRVRVYARATRLGSNLTTLTRTPGRSSRRLNAAVTRTGNDLQLDGVRHPEPTV
jgi:hypothetical protein